MAVKQGATLEVSVKGKKTALALPEDVQSMSALASHLAEALNLETRHFTIICKGKKHNPQEEPDKPLAQAGIQPGAKLLLLPLPSPEEITAIQSVPDQRIRGFDEELQAVMRRRQSHASATTLPSGPYTFQKYEAWDRPGLTPAPSEARKLLLRLAADRGIVGIMAQHRWIVGLLSEMPPEGKVGVSPVCILGVNINRGQEISLRLRTDDLRGFRRYDRIRETLVHELAHMVFGEHDNDFKELNSQLLREAKEHDWTMGARALVAEAAEFGSEGYVDPADVMAVTAQSSGAKLGGRRGVSVDARSAAVAAARARSPQGAGTAAAGGAPQPVAGGGEEEGAGIEGLGHADASTEDKEQAARELGQRT